MTTYMSKEQFEELCKRIDNSQKTTIIYAPTLLDISSQEFKEKLAEKINEIIKNSASLRSQIKSI